MESGREPRLVTSLHNPTIRFARNLQRRRFRAREQAVLVEGLRAVATALDHGGVPRAVIIDQRRVDDLPAELLDGFRVRRADVLLAAPDVFAAIADTEHPQPIVGIFETPDRPLPDDASLVLALDGIRDPGNLGALIRTAAAADTDAVVLLPDCVDPLSPKVIRASAGLSFAVATGHFADVRAASHALFSDSPVIVIADAEGDIEWDQVDWRRPTLLVMGGEATGPSETTRTYADQRVAVPMPRAVDSLNVAAAGAVLLFEIVRQRRGRG